MFERLSHVMLFVEDHERAVRWYQEVLGFAPRFVAPGYYASLFHESSGARIDLHPSEAGGKDVGFGPMPYFRVADLEAARKELAARGVRVGEINREGDGPRFMSFWDSEGNALGLEEG